MATVASAGTHKHGYRLDPEVSGKWWLAFWCEGCRHYAFVHRIDYVKLMTGKTVAVSIPGRFWNEVVKVADS